MAIGENFISSKSCTTREKTVTSLKLVASSGTWVFCLVLLCLDYSSESTITGMQQQ